MSKVATPTRERLDGASNVLLLANSLDANEDAACADLLTVEDPADENVLSVTFIQSPDDRLDVWRKYVGTELPGETGIIAVGEPTRSAAAATTSSQTTPAPGVSIATVPDPADLTGVGLEFSSYLSEWAESERQTVVCFHSVSALLQYADIKRAFRFLHVVTGRIRQVDAVAHYHLDPSVHDRQTVDTLTSLFDCVVELDADGEWHVKSR